MQRDQRVCHSRCLFSLGTSLKCGKQPETYAEEAGMSTKDVAQIPEEYQRRAQIDTATKQPAAMLVLLEIP